MERRAKRWPQTGADLKRKPGDLSHSKMGQQMDGELFLEDHEGKTPCLLLRPNLSEEERWEVVNYIGPSVKIGRHDSGAPSNGSPREEP